MPAGWAGGCLGNSPCVVTTAPRSDAWKLRPSSLDGYADNGGNVTRHRPLEGLGVFYALDQMKMWRVMNDSGGQVPFLQAWFVARCLATP